MQDTDPDRLNKIAQGREAEIFAWEDGAVLRLLRVAGGTSRLAHEAAAMHAAASCGVPVPAVRGLTTARGRPGIVMERVDGQDLLTGVGRRPWTLFRAARLTGQLQARLHTVVAPASLPDLRSLCERRIRSLDAPRELEHLRRFALATLDALPDGDRLCHGDFHPGNIIDGARGPVIIDWPNVTRGAPDADVARTALLLRLGEPPPGSPLLVRYLTAAARRLFLSRWAAAYRAMRRPDEEALVRWQVVRAAERLSEGIEGERPHLLRLIERRYRAR
ncbi:MAG: phosphotransferase [Chloroflexota bacterium]|nr:phosphotransferase [Chloroflexota bacterium]